ncbi:MAG: carboxypeptidase M32, partial [Planctomycetales bacterium]
VMAPTDQEAFDQLRRLGRETALLHSIDAVLGWDERVLLPPKAGEYRAEQITFLAGEIHRRWTSAEFRDLLGQLAESELAQDPHSDSGATIREFKRQFDRRNQLPQSLVEELARLSILGQQAWQGARQNDDFASFQPLLEQIVKLKRQEAEALGYEDCPYDALLDEFEPGEKTSTLTEVFAGLRDALVPLVAEIRESKQQPDRSILHRDYPPELQKSFGTEAAAAIGFEFDRGRLDETAHPFCSGMGPNDCRITTRYDRNNFGDAFFGILHEAGHGLYDQGLDSEHYGLPLGSDGAWGIHDSQSRMWEPVVGRSRAMWERFYPAAQERFPTALRDVSLDDFYFAVNDVKASLIRTEADEATYNLHVMIRFELEQALI